MRLPPSPIGVQDRCDTLFQCREGKERLWIQSRAKRLEGCGAMVQGEGPWEAMEETQQSVLDHPQCGDSVTCYCDCNGVLTGCKIMYMALIQNNVTLLC